MIVLVISVWIFVTVTVTSSSMTVRSTARQSALLDARSGLSPAFSATALKHVSFIHGVRAAMDVPDNCRTSNNVLMLTIFWI